MTKPIYIVDGARTPFLKARNRPGPFAASDLATDAGRALLLRQPFAPADLDEVILGCAAPSVDEVNIGRVAALRMGCGNKVPGWTVMRNCASGMQALDSAMDSMRAGRSHLVLAGGVDALSRAPLLFSDPMILVSGFNVYPNEIEGVVAQHPGVLECAAVGVPDPKSGEAVKLFVVKKDANLTTAVLAAYCREHLTGYKVPRHIEFRGALPKSTVGKILRRHLREHSRA